MNNRLYIVSKVLVYPSKNKYAVRLCCPVYTRHFLFGRTKGENCCCEIVAMNLEKETAVEMGERLSRENFAWLDVKED